MDVNWLAVVVATVAQFAVGGIWYMGLFSKLWGRMHGFDKVGPEKQKEMMSKMGPFYLLQLIVTAITAAVLAEFIFLLPDSSPYYLAFLAWLGFVVPTQVSGVVFGGTEPQWIVKKFLVQAGCSIVCLLVAAAVLQAF